ncbi:MAG: hypothetical protein JSV44_04830 [Candidatus Zixiibacteriota bacterium]|nr:MAG: hypothetical protein JSV44_04830 [candidate division Zixibacteria bacterium]
MKATFRNLIIAAVMALTWVWCTCAHAGGHWYTPDHAKMQYAGNMGLVSAGPGYSLFGGRLHLDLFYGYLPSFIGGVETHTVTTKIACFPVTRTLRETYTISPLTLGFNICIVIGENYFFRPPAHYPDDYYWATNLRIAPYLGTKVHKRLSSNGKIKGLDLYIEVGTVDIYLRDYVHSDYVGLMDIINFSFGLGIRFN